MASGVTGVTGDVDLIVVSTQDQCGLGRWLMGSAAKVAARGATVPMPLIRVSKVEVE